MDRWKDGGTVTCMADCRSPQADITSKFHMICVGGNAGVVLRQREEIFAHYFASREQ
jgi:hypothetical protein